MSAKKASPLAPKDDALRQRLEYLYARRAAVNQLIRSLEDYTASAALGNERFSRQSRSALGESKAPLVT
jgi:hypothetical protein